MTSRVWAAVVVTALGVATAAAVDIRHQSRVVAAAVAAGKNVAPPTRKPDAVRRFTDNAAGITLTYPASWSPSTGKTAELAVADPACGATLSLDVPAMSFHPMFIPLGIVASRYVDALRESNLPDAAVQETADLTVSGATARRVTAKGHACGGAVCIDTAVVMVHKGQVFILSCDSDPASQAAARSALDATVASVRWTK
jgi:hypothetical protein